MPTISLSPGIGEVGEAGLVSITIKNANPNCAEQLLHGDVWTLKFDLGDGQIRAIPSGVGVDSATMSPKDFEVAQSTDTWEVMIMYQGAPAAFGVEDAIVITPALQAPSTLRFSTVTLTLPRRHWSGDAERGSAATWSLVDIRFPTSEPRDLKGPEGEPAPLIR